MKAKSIDTISFKGQEAVLNAIELKEHSVFTHIKRFLNTELEIPITGLALTGILLFSVLVFKENKDKEVFYPIVVIEAGGNYEIY
jgi:hypothetical protein